MRKKITLIMTLLIITLGACSEKQDALNGETSYYASSNDLREETKSTDVLPFFLEDSTENMQIIYTAVAQHKNLLEHIPCYCGCGDELFAHKSNYDCFIFKSNDNGEVVWDDHATRCQACLDIAAESIMEYKDGKSIMNIRKQIDSKYENGYAEPTPTPTI